jgi:O-acetyl-ADP-ribose deacetylase (regulator of RNase III)
LIHEVEGDLLLTKAMAIAHGIAPNDDFHTGLALSLRERWPAMYKDFRHFCQTSHPKPGDTWTWAGADAPRIVNLFTQEGAYGHHGGKPGRAQTSYVSKGLRELRQIAEKEKFASIALPRIATGVGALDWADVKPLIERHLGDLGVPVIVYSVYRKGVQAREPL